METLGDALPKQIARNKELLEMYRFIGPTGLFGFLVISSNIEEGERALASGDAAEMLIAHAKLERNK